MVGGEADGKGGGAEGKVLCLDRGVPHRCTPVKPVRLRRVSFEVIKIYLKTNKGTRKNTKSLKMLTAKSTTALRSRPKTKHQKTGWLPERIYWGTGPAPSPHVPIPRTPRKRHDTGSQPHSVEMDFSPTSLHPQARAHPETPPTCPAIVGIRVQVIEALEVFRSDDGGSRSPLHQLPQGAGRASHSQPVVFSGDREELKTLHVWKQNQTPFKNKP